MSKRYSIIEAIVLAFFVLILLTGCITFKTSDGNLDSMWETPVEPKVVRLTTEKVEYDEDGTAYIIVSFPRSSVDHEFVFSKGEVVAVGILKP